MHLVEHRVTVPHEHEIIGIRELAEDETTAIKAADELVHKIATAHWYRRLQGLGRLTDGRIALVEAHDEPHPSEVQACRQAVLALVDVQRRLVEDVTGLVETHAPDAARDALVGEITATSETNAWLTLASLDGDAQLAFDRQPRLGILGARGEFQALGPLVAAAMAEVDAAFGAILRGLSEAVLTAAQKLRALHVECPQGLPCLLDVDALVEAERSGQPRMTPEDLALHDIHEALRLVRMAERLADSHEEPLATFSEEDGGEEQEGAAVEAEPDERAHGVGDEALAGKADEAEPNEDPVGPDAGGESDDGDREEEGQEEAGGGPVIDLRGLIHEAQRLNQKLDDAWSDALHRALTTEGIARQMAALRASIQGLYRTFHDEEDPVRLVEFPPGPDLLEEYERDPDRVRERYACAQLVAFTQVLETIELLSRPTRVQVSFGQGMASEQLSRFWESGAFAAMRSALQLLDQLLSDPPPAGAAYPIETDRRLRLAQRSWRSGDPEACLFHAACGLAAHAGRPLGELDEVGTDHPRHKVAQMALRALEAQLSGTTALDMSTLTADGLADFVVDVVIPAFGPPGLGADALFDLIARDVPHVPLEDK